MRISTLVVAFLVVVVPSDAAAQSIGSLIPPVDAGVVRHFDAPSGAFGPGHRGVDYATAPGTLVRAAGSGRITFAGTVAGTRAVTIDHGGGLESTYSELSRVSVAAGDRVAPGTWVGTSARAHPGVEGFHFGVKLNDVYVDPAVVVVPSDLGSALRLTPLLWEPSAEIAEPLAAALAPTGPGSHEPACVRSRHRSSIQTAPNDNVVIAVAGIASKTKGPDAADMYDPGPTAFGYPPERAYLFSYRGSDDRDLHLDYERTDTYGDIDSAARRLSELVERVRRRHPGRGIDLMAHSQGGVVARTYLVRHAASTGARIENLVTFASPHAGAPVADNVPHLRDRTASGPLLLHLGHRAASRGAPSPDPLSPAVAQLGPSSRLMRSLARRDVVFGTRVLTLGIPNDLIVPADRTSMPGSRHRLVPPLGGVGGHSAIVTSPVAAGYAYDFLRGAAHPCTTVWDDAGVHLGRVVSLAQSKLGAAVSLVEGPAGPALNGVVGNLPWL